MHSPRSVGLQNGFSPTVARPVSAAPAPPHALSPRGDWPPAGRHRPSHAQQITRAPSCLLESVGSGSGRGDETQARYTSVLHTPPLASCRRREEPREEGDADRPVRVRVGVHVRCPCVARSPPHPRQEGPLGETVDLPTCRVFAKTKTQDFEGNPAFSVGAPGARGGLERRQPPGLRGGHGLGVASRFPSL